MRIVDGVAYADEAEQEMKVLDIRVLEGYKLWLRFNNEETRVFDFVPLLGMAAFTPLADKEVFAGVRIEHGVPTWNSGETDISPRYLYDNSREDILKEEA